MKNLKFFEKVVFLINSVVAFMLLMSYVLPLVPPKTFSLFSVLSLGVPFLIILNFIFFIYWLIKIKKQLLLSMLVLGLGYFLFGSLYKFAESKDVDVSENFSVMNYNVRLFNLYEWIPEKNIETKILNLIKKEKPDVVCFQEYHPHKSIDLSSYSYKYEKLSGKKNKYGQAIFSNFPIINSGSIEFPHTSNNAIYTDIVKGKDTIRIYNIHLQSLRLDKKLEDIKKEDSERLVKGVGKTFEMQQFQTELFLLHKRQSKHKMIVCGDFNNTAFSYVYKEIKGDLNDAFKEAGNGFGRTYDFKYFPARIDFIFSDPSFSVNGFKTFDSKYSDHYPIMAKFSLE